MVFGLFQIEAVFEDIPCAEEEHRTARRGEQAQGEHTDMDGRVRADAAEEIVQRRPEAVQLPAQFRLSAAATRQPQLKSWVLQTR